MKQPIAIWITDTHLSENTIEINKSIFNQVFALCDELNLKTVIHGGDCFNSRKGQTEIVLNTFKQILDEAANQNIKILAIAGNHDKTDLTANESFLDAFDGHPAFEVMGVGAAFSSDKVDITFLPYFDETLTYPEKLKDVKKIIDKDRFNILCTHVGVDTAETNSGSKIESELKSDSFKEFDYVLCGHYHNRQIIWKDKFIYTGSAYQANFGENEEKNVVVIYDDIEESFEFVKLEFPKYVTIDILPEYLNSELIEQITLKLTEAKVRVRIVGDIAEDKKHYLLSLQSVGAKVEVEKESFTSTEIAQNKKVVLSDVDIFTTFDEWGKDRKIENMKYGKKLLKEIA